MSWLGAPKLKFRKALLGLLFVTFSYVGALIWADARTETYGGVLRLAHVLPWLLIIAFFSFAVRFLRWHWLLMRLGSRTGLLSGFIAYFSGFAFTATPGKVGELIRIRYLAPLGVVPAKVISAFVYERAIDLAVVMCLAALAIDRLDVLLLALGFVAITLSTVVLVAFNGPRMRRGAAYLRHRKQRRFARLLTIFSHGITGCRAWMTWLDVLVATGLGILAWGLLAWAFYLLLNSQGISLPGLSGFSVYPLSMLAGAASMLPGGLVSTETTIVGLLAFHQVSLEVAVVCAVGIRLSTLWFSIACGLIALAFAEANFRRQSTDGMLKSW